jgi:hypothetical protein
VVAVSCKLNWHKRRHLHRLKLKWSLRIHASNQIVKTKCLISSCIVAATLATAAFSLTTELAITSDYVREHPDDFSVSAAKGKDGLIDFTITHNVATPMYHVAHLAI